MGPADGSVETFPFGDDFQKSLLRLLCEDDDFAHAACRFLRPEHFANEVLAWAFGYVQRHREQYKVSPSADVLTQKAAALDPRFRSLYEAVVRDVAQAPLRDEAWLRDQVLDFVKRNIFVQTFHEARGLYNTGKVTEAYDVMMDRMDELHKVAWEPANESLFFEDLPRRQAARMQGRGVGDVVPTGYPFLDKVLDGGHTIGEMGIWVAYPKIGKSTLLANLGKNAVSVGFRTAAHFVLEGTRRQTENRYDSIFTGELYANVKRGDIDSERYVTAYRNYQQLRGRLVIRAMTEHFEYSVVDIQNGLDDIKRRHGIVPEVVIVDYGDLLGGRDTRGYRTETEKQKAAFRDLHVLATRGYAVWTASQAQRPREGTETKAELLRARQIADCYEKVRVADFIGSINVTLEERSQGILRLYAELYRDAPADVWQTLRAQLDTMTIRQEPGLMSPSVPAAGENSDPALGYVPKQTFTP